MGAAVAEMIGWDAAQAMALHWASTGRFRGVCREARVRGRGPVVGRL